MKCLLTRLSTGIVFNFSLISLGTIELTQSLEWNQWQKSFIGKLITSETV